MRLTGYPPTAIAADPIQRPRVRAVSIKRRLNGAGETEGRRRPLNTPAAPVGRLRPADAERNDGIGRMIAAGQSWSSIQAATGCSRATIAKIAKRLKPAA